MLFERSTGAFKLSSIKFKFLQLFSNILVVGITGRRKMLSNKILFLVFVCLIAAVLSFHYIFKGYLYPLPPVFKPPSNVMYHNPDDTKAGDCLKNYFEDVLLIIVYHYPFYDSIPLLKSFYKDAFKDILICGPEAYFHHFVMVVDVGPGLYGYECAGAAIRRYPGYRGYLYVNDDMVVNWWTFSNLDKEKFWQGGIIIAGQSHIMGNRPIPDKWPWWEIKSKSAEACEDSYLEITHKYRSSEYLNITELVNTHVVNCEGEKCCFRAWSDLFYVPKKFSDQFQRLSFVFHKNRVFLEVAVPTIMSFLDLRDSWEKHYGVYLPDQYGSINFADGKLVWKNYNYDINFIHPVKFNGGVAERNREKLKNDIIPYSKRYTSC